MQARVLARMGFEPVLAPTVLFGRHPGLGAPGGGAVEPALFAGLLEGIAANGVLERVAAVICGYFADTGQIDAAVRLLGTLRAASPEAWIVVDPIMGDDLSGLYVSDEVAAKIAAELVPLADLLCPNVFELGRLAGGPASDASAALAAARLLDRPVLVSSVAAGPDIGVLLADRDEAWLASHPRAKDDPKGMGDLLTALFVGHRLSGSPANEALRDAVSEVASGVLERRAAVRMAKL
jgi:pyridoxine kinase